MVNCCKTSGSSKKLIDLAEILMVIAEPNRLKILCFLSHGERCVCEVQKALSLKQNLVSHHLKVLRDNGLIDYKKDGQWMHYFLNTKRIEKYKSLFNKILTK